MSKKGVRDFSKVVKQRLFTGLITMEAIFDVSELEIFADKGTFACAQLVYPTKPYNKISIAGNVKSYYHDIKL